MKVKIFKIFIVVGVMGLDEYYFNINNFVFMNYNVKFSMELFDFLMKK